MIRFLGSVLIACVSFVGMLAMVKLMKMKISMNEYDYIQGKFDQKVDHLGLGTKAFIYEDGLTLVYRVRVK